MTTRTGTFQIGLRVGDSGWQKDLPGVASWAAQAGFESLDLGSVGPEEIRFAQNAGMDVTCVDALDWPGLLSEDPGRRKDAIARNAAYFRQTAAHDVHVFLAVATPENRERHPRENLELALTSYVELAEVAHSLGSRFVLEGWPGASSRCPNLCCNPEQCRAILKAIPSNGLGLCYNPAHLVRMGIDHTRFLDEFATRIGHVRAVDAEILTDNVYEVGLYQKSLGDSPSAFGELAWRYTIPGHGIARWSYIFRTLQLAGYKGRISIELRDAEFAGTPEAEKVGLLASLHHLHNT